ncbi:hypothetical protein TWF225_000439 [Orbilia oligospora]|nr:hypothetical protein TWF225_000439 [Orbilia oligospora]KAF3276227.1 hypothetical protein TWF132_002277 [Orbilia oligospora]
MPVVILVRVCIVCNTTDDEAGVFSGNASRFHLETDVLDYLTVGKNFTNSPSGASPGQISLIKIGMDHVIGIQAKSPHTTGLTRSFSQPQVARKMLKFKRKGDTPVETLVHVL